MTDFRPPRQRPPRPAREPAAPSRRNPAEGQFPPGPERTQRIAGLPAVDALFQRNAGQVLRLFYEDRMVPRVGDFCRTLARLHRPYRLVDGEELTRVAGTVHHGGIVAVASLREVPELDLEEARGWAAAGHPLFVLDGIGNPHNLGAVARSLAFFGIPHLAISDHPAQTGLSDSAFRIAEGGLEYLTLHRVSRLPESLRRLSASYRVLGTALGRGAAPEALAEDARPCLLVLGNEEDGLPPATLRACEAVVSLPGAGTVQSLNVSATAAILAYALRTRPLQAPPRGPAAKPVPRRKPRRDR